jgi:hypothetical protein
VGELLGERRTLHRLGDEQRVCERKVPRTIDFGSDSQQRSAVGGSSARCTGICITCREKAASHVDALLLSVGSTGRGQPWEYVGRRASYFASGWTMDTLVEIAVLRGSGCSVRPPRLLVGSLRMPRRFTWNLRERAAADSLLRARISAPTSSRHSCDMDRVAATHATEHCGCGSVGSLVTGDSIVHGLSVGSGTWKRSVPQLLGDRLRVSVGLPTRCRSVRGTNGKHYGRTGLRGLQSD